MKGIINNKKTLILAVAFFLAAIFFVYSNTRSKSAEFVTIKSETYKETFLASGILKLDNGILVEAEQEGTLKADIVEAGQLVKAGDILAVLDNPDTVLRLREAQSDYRKAQADLAGTGSQSQKTQQLVIDQLKLELEKLRKNKERFEELALQGAVSISELEAVQHDYALKQAEISTAESRLNEIRSDSAASVNSASSTVERQQVAIKQAELDVDRLTIRAPFDGIVIRSDLEAGEAVKAGDGIVFMAKSVNKYCEIEPDEQYLPLLEIGQPVSLYADQAADKPISGQVAWISSEIEADTGTVKVRINLLEDRPWLIQNMLLRCEILLATYPDSLVLPAEYILEGTESTVYVEENGRAVVKTITINEVDSGQARVLSGLQSEDRVLDPTGLKAGDRVTLAGEGAVEK